MTFASVLLLAAGFALSGAGLLVLLLPSRSLGRLEFAGAAFVLGFGVVGLLGVVVMAAGGGIGPALPATTALAGALLVLWKRPGFRRAEPAGLAGLGGRVLTAVAATLGLALAVSADDPGYDVRAFWSLKSRSIERHGTFRNPDFEGDARPHGCVRYPLLLPVVHALVHRAAGDADDGRLIRLTMALFYVASLGVVGAALRSRLSPGAAALATAVFALLPAVLTGESGGALSGYADYPLSIFLLMGVLQAQRWLSDGNRRAAALSAVAFACASQLKLEGTIMAAAAGLLVPLFAVILRGPRALGTGLAVPALGILLGAAWVVLARAFPAGATTDHALAGVDALRIPGILRVLGSNLLRVKEWGLLWALALMAVVLRRPRWRDPESLAFSTGTLMFTAYVGIWATLDVGGAKEAMRHNTTRLVLHLAPLFFVWAAGRLGDAAAPPRPIPQGE